MWHGRRWVHGGFSTLECGDNRAPNAHYPPAVPEDPPLAEPNPAPAPLADAPPAVAGLSPAACAAELATRFPAVFGPGAPRPLKLRIQADVQQRAPGVFTRKALSHFLHRHTTTTAYLRAVVSMPQRTDLDGLPAGDVAEEHRQAAAAELERRRANHEARRAAEREAQRKAHDQERRVREADDVARGERAALLRAYETTTLTRANFCALKQLPQAELDARLAQARQEREQRVQPPRPDHAAARPSDRGPRPAHSTPPHRRPAAAPKSTR
jgi:ProP effector